MTTYLLLFLCKLINKFVYIYCLLFSQFLLSFIIINHLFIYYNYFSLSVYKDGDLNYPIVEERVWERNAFHYDNVAKAILTLFVCATFEGWPGILYVSIDSNAEDIGPVHNYRPIVAIFYFIYIIIIGM